MLWTPGRIWPYCYMWHHLIRWDYPWQSSINRTMFKSPQFAAASSHLSSRSYLTHGHICLQCWDPSQPVTTAHQSTKNRKEPNPIYGEFVVFWGSELVEDRSLRLRLQWEAPARLTCACVIDWLRMLLHPSWSALPILTEISASWGMTLVWHHSSSAIVVCSWLKSSSLTVYRTLQLQWLIKTEINYILCWCLALKVEFWTLINLWSWSRILHAATLIMYSGAPEQGPLS